MSSFLIDLEEAHCADTTRVFPFLRLVVFECSYPEDFPNCLVSESQTRLYSVFFFKTHSHKPLILQKKALIRFVTRHATLAAS